MVRITLYDPQVSAAVYSERRVAEEGFDSGVATGLARLGRALSERERGLRMAGERVMALEAATGFWEGEISRLDAAGARIPPGKPGFHDAFMKDHLARRETIIAGLKETSPGEAERFDARTQPLVKSLSRRATAMESGAAGETLSAGLGAALKMAVRAVGADPLQHDDIRDGFLESLTEMEGDGVDAGTLVGIRKIVERNLGVAAVGGMIEDGEFETARELLASGRMPALTPEDVAELDRRVGRAEARSVAAGSAENAAARDAYWAGFDALAASLRAGGEASDVRFTDGAIRAALPVEQATKMIALRDEAEDAGAAVNRVGLAPPEAVVAMIAAAPPNEARRLRAAARERDRLLAEDPAAYVLRNGRVQVAHDGWQAAIAEGDSEAIAGAARAYARASLDEQRRLGVAEAARRVLPAESAAAMVTEFTSAERPDPAALGAELRARFGEHWRPVLEDLKTAGLPDGMAAIAAMNRPEQQAAAQRLSALVGTQTSKLRGRAGEVEAAAIDAALPAALLGVAINHAQVPIRANSTAGHLALRRAYALASKGETPYAAALQAARDLSPNDGRTTRPERPGSSKATLSDRGDTRKDGEASPESIADAIDDTLSAAGATPLPDPETPPEVDPEALARLLRQDGEDEEDWLRRIGDALNNAGGSVESLLAIREAILDEIGFYNLGTDPAMPGAIMSEADWKVLAILQNVPPDGWRDALQFDDSTRAEFERTGILPPTAVLGPDGNLYLRLSIVGDTLIGTVLQEVDNRIYARRPQNVDVATLLLGAMAISAAGRRGGSGPRALFVASAVSRVFRRIVSQRAAAPGVAAGVAAGLAGDTAQRQEGRSGMDPAPDLPPAPGFEPPEAPDTGRESLPADLPPIPLLPGFMPEDYPNLVEIFPDQSGELPTVDILDNRLGSLDTQRFNTEAMRRLLSLGERIGVVVKHLAAIIHDGDRI